MGAMVMRTVEPSETESHRTAQSTPCPSPRIKLQSEDARLGVGANIEAEIGKKVSLKELHSCQKEDMPLFRGLEN